LMTSLQRFHNWLNTRTLDTTCSQQQTHLATTFPFHAFSSILHTDIRLFIPFRQRSYLNHRWELNGVERVVFSTKTMCFSCCRQRGSRSVRKTIITLSISRKVYGGQR
jgi:hypothetical protein